MKNIMCLACVLVFFVVGGAGAVPQSVEMGLYTVTFDLGSLDEVQLSEFGPWYTDVFGGGACIKHQITVRCELEWHIVSLYELLDPDDRWTNVTLDDLECLLAWYEYELIPYETREIDGRPGILAHVRDTINPGDEYHTIYRTDYGRAVVYIECMDGDENARSLLDTIHVERRE